MTFGVFIGWNTLFIFVFAAIYFVAKEIIRVNQKDRQWIVWLVAFGLGVYMMLIDTWMTFEDTNLQTSYKLMLVEIVFLSTLLDLRFFVGTVPFLIGSAFIGEELSWEIFQELIPVLSLLVTSIAVRQISWFQRNGTSDSVSLLLRVGAVAFGQVFYHLITYWTGPQIPGAVFPYAQMIFATVGYYLIASLVQYIPIYFVDRMYRNFFNLEKAEKLDETGFVKPAVAGEVFDLYTDQKRITNAVFVSLKTKEDTTALKKLFEDYNSDTLFFKPTPDVYGFLVPLKNKDIQNFESVVRTIELGLRATLMEYKAGATYYGPNTERFDELAEQSLYALNDSNNDLLIYDYRSIKEVLSARENVAKTSFYSTQTKISYLNSITASKNTIIPVYDNEGFENFEEEILTLDKETRAMILSQLALRILKEDNQFDTVIPYSIKSIENVDEFTKKVKEYKDPSNVVIAVYYEDLKVKKEMMDKVKELRSNGFRISINNFNKVNERLLKTYKPEFVQSIKKRTLTDFTTPVEQMMEEVRKVSPNTIELG